MSGKKGFGGWFGHHGHHGHNAGLKLQGTKAGEVLTGGHLDDQIYGGRGDDTLLGGGGNDTLYGDGKAKAWGWDKCVWWSPRASDDDFLDGGAGSDKVFGGRGDDVLLYSMAGNLGAGFVDAGAHDLYDGGSGIDTLRLELTYGEFLLDSVRQDIAAFEAFLDARANPRSDHGKTFEFKSFDLDARNFEALDVALVNGAPTALDDAEDTDEDTPITIAPASVLANDSDADHLDVLCVIDANPTSTLGAVVAIDANGNLSYDPSDAPFLQQLAQGATVVDSFTYTIADLGGATATATVQITVTGVNDLPDALNDEETVLVTGSGGGGQPDERLITFDGAASAGDVDGYAFAGFSLFGFAGVGGSAMAAAGTGNDNVGGEFDADGAVTRVDGQDFALKSLAIAAFFVEPTVTIVGYNDGAAVDGAEISLTLNAAYVTIDFGAAWASVDEVRFYAELDPNQGMSGDYVLIDNLTVASGSGGGGTPTAEPIDIDVLANDTDIDAGDELALLSFDGTSEMGALISQNDDGTLHYDPTGIDLPVLAAGEKAFDTFEYTVSDGHGGTDVASVSIELLGAGDPALLGSLGAPDVDLL